ncbi:MAG TPA: hypothetical protein VES73_09175, partial [Lamprocystis sp. (in: g-proteobacteria)]|nr:hypothetical protein [Lamprocystis sp. (in: g-proteobacteria)]
MQARFMKPALAVLAPALAPTLALGALLGAAPAAAAVDPYDGAWHFSVTPYLWLPNINGSMDSQVSGLRSRATGAMEDVRVNAEIGPNDYLENLEFAVMVAGEAR